MRLSITFILVFFVPTYSFSQSKSVIDSLQFLYQRTEQDTSKVLLLCSIAFEYRNTNPDTCIKIAQEALKKSEIINYDKGKAWAANRVGLGYYLRGNYNIAIKYYQQALRIFEKIDDKRGLTSCLGNIGNMYAYQNDDNLALEYYKKSLSIDEQINNQKGIAMTLNNIGYIYEKKKNYTEALNHYKKSLTLKTNLKDQRGIANSLNNIGNIYFIQKEYALALEYQEKSLQTATAIRDKLIMTYPLNSIAQIYQKQKKYAQSSNYALQGLKIAQEIKTLKEINLLSQTLYETYKQQGDFQEALIYHELYKNTNDSIFNLSKAKEIIRLQTAFDVERKEIAFQKQKLVVEQQKIALYNLEEANRNKVLALISLGILLAILALGGYLYYRNRQLKNQFALLESEQRWRRSQMNPHFFFNALSAIQKFVMQAEPLKATGYIAKFARLMRQVLEQSQDDRISLAEEIETVNNYIQLQQLRFSEKFDYQLIVSDNLDIENMVLPPMLVQPIIENAIEHGLADNAEKGLLEVRIQPHTNQTFSICIENTSTGIKSTSDETIKPAQHRSFATKIITERINLLKKQQNLNISYQITEKPDQTGRKVEFILPL
jgi:sensor histidine kinase YesM